MVEISEEDCRVLEQKIQAEIQKIFSDFLRNHAERTPGLRKASSSGRTQRRDGHRTADSLAKKTAPASTKKRSGGGKTFDTNRLLYGAPERKNRPGNSIEEDMVKIFGRKYRKRSKQLGVRNDQHRG